MQEELKRSSFKARRCFSQHSTKGKRSRCCGLAGKNHLSCKQQSVGLLPGALAFYEIVSDHTLLEAHLLALEVFSVPYGQIVSMLHISSYH